MVNSVLKSRSSSPRRRASFTLIELLVVLAIVAILSVVVIMTLNPSELLKQARDSNRLSDLGTLNTALAAYEADVNQGFMGTSSVVYVSIPDTSPTCDNLGLPTSTGAGFTYHCVTSQNLKNSDGTGWIPVNFSQISFGSPISSLPVDPTNTTSSGNYYTYVSGGSFILTAIPESQKQKTALSSNPNISNYPGVIAMGNNLSLSPLYSNAGLVGYWNFDEGSGTVAKDSSGNGNNGVYSGNVTLGQPGASAQTGRSISTAAAIAKITIPPMGYTPMTLVALHRRDDSASGTNYKDFFSATGNVHHMIIPISSRRFSLFNGGFYNSTITEPNDDLWHQYVLVYKNGNTQDFYFDGKFVSSVNSTIDPIANPINYLGNWGNGYYNVGPLDDVRIYSRALSAAEISALYNATK